MERVLFRHLTGSKANTVDSYALDGFSLALIGRDPAATVRYDATRDNLVGRQHARISRDAADPYRFLVSDLASRNGTYINGTRIIGTAPIAPGDVLQFGLGGPELEFQIDPVPAQFAKKRRHPVPTTLEATHLARALQPTAPVPGERSWKQSALVAVALIAALLGTLALVTCRIVSDGALFEQQANAGAVGVVQ